jgi:fused signal recognition particle receptor
MALTLWSRLRTLLVGGAARDVVMDLEQVLLEADFGPAATFDLVERFDRRRRRAEFGSEAALREAVVGELAELLADEREPAALELGDGRGPAVILIVGVNGVGKTTTAAKLAARLVREGRRPLLAAADTFRAAAVEQLTVWAERLEVPCVAGAPGGDPAAVVFDAIEAAERRGADVVIADTAGRLHTKTHLLDELAKIVRVAGKRRADAPHETLLVVDGTTGQNALQQGRVFREAVPLTGVIVTKLDGTARGGTVVALRRELDLPIRFVGVGEGVGDLQPFDPRTFAERLAAA